MIEIENLVVQIDYDSFGDASSMLRFFGVSHRTIGHF